MFVTDDVPYPWLLPRVAAVVHAVSVGVGYGLGMVFGAVVERTIVKPLHARPLDAILATWNQSDGAVDAFEVNP